MFWPSILRTSRREEHGSDLTLVFFSTDRCTQAPTPSCPFPFSPFVMPQNIAFDAGDVTFDARFLHSFHVASVQAHVPVNLIDGVVCADSVLVTAGPIFWFESFSDVLCKR